MPKPLLTAAEVAALLRVHVETVYALIAQQGLPAARVGGRWRFEEAKVREWFAAQYAPRNDGAAHPSTRDRDDDTPLEEAQT